MQSIDILNHQLKNQKNISFETELIEQFKQSGNQIVIVENIRFNNHVEIGKERFLKALTDKTSFYEIGAYV